MHSTANANMQQSSDLVSSIPVATAAGNVTMPIAGLDDYVQGIVLRSLQAIDLNTRRSRSLQSVRTTPGSDVPYRGVFTTGVRFQRGTSRPDGQRQRARSRSRTRSVSAGTVVAPTMMVSDRPVFKRDYYIKGESYHLSVSVVPNYQHLRHHYTYIRGRDVDVVSPALDAADPASKLAPVFERIADDLVTKLPSLSVQGFVADDAFVADRASNVSSRRRAVQPRVNVVVPANQRRRRGRLMNTLMMLIMLFLIVPGYGDYITSYDCPEVVGLQTRCLFPSVSSKKLRALPHLAKIFTEPDVVYGPFSEIHGRVRGKIPTSADLIIKRTRSYPCEASLIQSPLGAVLFNGSVWLINPDGYCPAFQTPHLKGENCPSSCSWDKVVEVYKCEATSKLCTIRGERTGEALFGNLVRTDTATSRAAVAGESGSVPLAYCFSMRSKAATQVPCHSSKLLPAEVHLGFSVAPSRPLFRGNYIVIYVDAAHEYITINGVKFDVLGGMAIVVRNQLMSDTTVTVESPVLGKQSVSLPADLKRYTEPPIGPHACEYSSDFQWRDGKSFSHLAVMCEPIHYDVAQQVLIRDYEVPVTLSVTPSSVLGVQFANIDNVPVSCVNERCAIPGDVKGRVIVNANGVIMDLGYVVGKDCAVNPLHCMNFWATALVWAPLIPIVIVTIATLFVPRTVVNRMVVVLIVFALSTPPITAAHWRLGAYVILGALVAVACLMVRRDTARRPYVFLPLVVLGLLVVANSTMAEVCSGVRCGFSDNCVRCLFSEYRYCEPSPAKACALGTYDLAPPYINQSFCLSVRKYYKTIVQEFWRFSWRGPNASLCVVSPSVLVGRIQSTDVLYSYGVMKLQAPRRTGASFLRSVLSMLTSWFLIPGAMATQDVTLPAGEGSCVTASYTTDLYKVPLSICVARRSHTLILHHVYDAVDCEFASATEAHCAVNVGDHPCERAMQTRNKRGESWTGCISVYHHDCKGCVRDYLAKPCWTLPQYNMRNYFYRMMIPSDADRVEIYKYTGVVDTIELSINGSVIEFGKERIWSRDGRVVELLAAAAPFVFPVSTILRFDKEWFVSAIDASLYDPNGVTFCLQNLKTKTLSYDENAYREALRDDRGFPVPKRLRSKFLSGSLDAVALDNYMSHGCRLNMSTDISLESCQGGSVAIRLSGDWVDYSTQVAVVTDLVAKPHTCLSTMSYAIVEITLYATTAGTVTLSFEPDSCVPRMLSVPLGRQSFYLNCLTRHRGVILRVGTLSSRFSVECIATEDIDTMRYDVVHLNSSHSVGWFDMAELSLALWRERYLKWVYVGVCLFLVLVVFPLVAYCISAIRARQRGLAAPSFSRLLEANRPLVRSRWRYRKAYRGA